MVIKVFKIRLFLNCETISYLKDLHKTHLKLYSKHIILEPVVFYV